MTRRTIIPDPLPILLSILVVTGFQVYWLKNNYEREKRSLQGKVSMDFRETVHELQAAKLKFNVLPDSGSNMRIIVRHDELGPRKEDSDLPRFRVANEELITLVNSARDSKPEQTKRRSLNTVIKRKNGTIIKDSISVSANGDSLVAKKTNFLRLLYKVDSLQDTLKISEIEKAFSRKLRRDRSLVPFTIQVIDSVAGDDDQPPEFFNVAIGFAHPRTYHLELGNTFPFLVKKIAAPIFFSIFLVGLTIISFWILYHNLLRQRKLAAIKNEFISNMTHELKTPISTVGVAIEALRNFDARHDPVKTKEYLDISAAELQRLSLLVDKVLKLSLFENKNVELKKELVDMRRLANEVMQMMKLQFEKRNAKVTFTTTGDNFTVDADRLHLASVLYNLLDNALKYSPANPVITIELLSLSNNMLEIKVRDNGVGIDKEYHEKIFEKFFRIPHGDKHNIKGYGLGLSYVKEILSSHEGNIVVENAVAAGSTFIITLPLSKKSDKDDEEQSENV